MIDKLHTAQFFKLGTFVPINEDAIKWVISLAEIMILQEDPLIELEGPIKVAGDFHG